MMMGFFVRLFSLCCVPGEPFNLERYIVWIWKSFFKNITIFVNSYIMTTWICFLTFLPIYNFTVLLFSVRFSQIYLPTIILGIQLKIFFVLIFNISFHCSIFIAFYFFMKALKLKYLIYCNFHIFIINHMLFKVNHSLVFSIFTELSSRHFYMVLGQSYHPKKKSRIY